MSDLIEASSVRCQTMADDSLRLTIDIDPRFAHDAFVLFGRRGVPMVIGRLVMEHEREPEMKGGPLAKLAGMWLHDSYFAEWVRYMGGDDPDMFIKMTCDIDSKRELDHDAKAADVFHQAIRIPFAEWLKGRQ